MNTTITIKLKTRLLNKNKIRILKNLSQEYSQSTNWFLKESKNIQNPTRASLHKHGYNQAKEQFNLQAGLIGTSLQKAVAIRKGYQTAVNKRNKTNQKRILLGKKPLKSIKEPFINKVLPINYRNDIWRLIENNGNHIIKIPTTGEKNSQVNLPVIVPDYHLDKLKGLLNGDYKQGILDVILKGDDCYVFITLNIPGQEVPVREEWLGVDLGIVNIAVTSDGKFYGGKEVRYRKNRWVERRQGLQQAGRLSRVKKEQGKERRWVRDINHKISRNIVDDALKSGKGIALENLRGIHNRVKSGSKKLNRMNSGWSFNELKELIEYKAGLAGVPVVLVDPRETSRICSRCGCSSKDNRLSQAVYKCQDCGFELHADLNAARNIATRARINAGQVDLVQKRECGTPDGLMVFNDFIENTSQPSNFPLVVEAQKL